MSMSFRNNVFSMGSNGFSTANRYPRQVALAADTVMTMVQGRSFAFNAVQQGPNGIAISWRYECGALTFSENNRNATIPTAGFAIDKPIAV